MLGAVIVVLLIACVNVMNMQFGRAALRAKELAIRGALGATRWRIVRQMLTESLLVASLGAIVGVLMAYWAVGLLVRATSALCHFPLPYWVSFDIDAPVLAFTVGITLVATMFSGLDPGLAQRARQSRRSNERRRARKLQPFRQWADARPRYRANCVDRRALDRGHAAGQIRPQSDQARLRLRRGCRLQRPDGSVRRRLSYLGSAPAVFRAGLARAPDQSGV